MHGIMQAGMGAVRHGSSERRRERSLKGSYRLGLEQ
jgi:hypothetical protein